MDKTVKVSEESYKRLKEIQKLFHDLHGTKLSLRAIVDWVIHQYWKEVKKE